MSKILTSIIACVCVSWMRVESKQLRDNQEELFLRLTNRSVYNLRIRPFNTIEDDGAVKINVSMYLFGLASMDDLRSEYQVTTLLRLRWQDDRLAFNKSEINSATTMSSREEILLVGDNWHADRIWIPSVSVVNEKGSGSLNTFIKGSVLIQISEDGNVLLSMRALLRLGCNMKYHYYPLDVQTCIIDLESGVLSDDNMKLLWSLNDPIKLDEFEMPGFRLTHSTLQHNETKKYDRTGNFSHLSVKFHLSREFQHFLLEAYMPSALFVFTSWTSFFVDIQAAPARVTIGITSMLTLITSLKSIREKLPRYSYISALDVWNFACTAFVFASLIEYAVVNFIYNKEKRKRGYGALTRRNSSVADLYSLKSSRNSLASIFNTSQMANNNNGNNLEGRGKDCKFTVGDDNLYQTGKGFKLYVPGGESKSGNAHFNPSSKRVSVISMTNSENIENCGGLSWLLPKSPRDIANGIDKKSRFLFPILFLIFNVIYWSVVINKSTIL